MPCGAALWESVQRVCINRTGVGGRCFCLLPLATLVSVRGFCVKNSTDRFPMLNPLSMTDHGCSLVTLPLLSSLPGEATLLCAPGLSAS